MSTAIVIKTADVMDLCLKCINDIDKERKILDATRLTDKVTELKNKNLLLNRYTLGLVKIKSDKNLSDEADKYLRRYNYFYPDVVRAGKWRNKAISLHNLAKLSESQFMNIGIEDLVVLKWAHVFETVKVNNENECQDSNTCNVCHTCQRQKFNNQCNYCNK